MATELEKLRRLKKISEQKTLQSGGFTSEQTAPEMSEIVKGDLQELESQIEKLDNRAWESAWLIGQRLILVKQNFLTGLGFLNISEYASERFGFSHATTVRMIFLASSFPLSTARYLGSKLRLLQPLDENKRAIYLEWIEKENPTFREIEAKIKLDKNIKTTGKAKPEISLQKTKLIVDFKKMNAQIKNDKKGEFLEELKKLIKKYSTN